MLLQQIGPQVLLCLLLNFNNMQFEVVGQKLVSFGTNGKSIFTSPKNV